MRYYAGPLTNLQESSMIAFITGSFIRLREFLEKYQLKYFISPAEIALTRG